MTNKNKLLLAVVICLMGGMLAMKWASERAAPTQANVAMKAPAEEAAPVSAPIQMPQSGNAMGETDPAIFKDLPTGPEPAEILGPPDMSRDACMSTYRKFPRIVAFYSQSLGGDDAKDFGLCHAALTGDDSYGGFVSNNTDQLRSRIVNSRMIYTAAKGKIDLPACTQAMAMSKMSPQNVQIQKVCEAVGAAILKSVKSGSGLSGGAFSDGAICSGLSGAARQECRSQVGRIKPDSRWEKNFLYLSGPSACSELKGVGKEDCLLYADIVTGVRKGRGSWLYEAFAGNGCKRIDEDLVGLYCSNKLRRRPVRAAVTGGGAPRPEGGSEGGPEGGSEGGDASSFGE